MEVTIGDVIKHQKWHIEGEIVDIKEEENGVIVEPGLSESEIFISMDEIKERWSVI